MCDCLTKIPNCSVHQLMSLQQSLVMKLWCKVTDFWTKINLGLILFFQLQTSIHFKTNYVLQKVDSGSGSGWRWLLREKCGFSGLVTPGLLAEKCANKWAIDWLTHLVQKSCTRNRYVQVMPSTLCAAASTSLVISTLSLLVSMRGIYCSEDYVPNDVLGPLLTACIP